VRVLFASTHGAGRVAKLIEERGGVDAEIGARIERLLLYSRVELRAHRVDRDGHGPEAGPLSP
jgi:hypothetical protein